MNMPYPPGVQPQQFQQQPNTLPQQGVPMQPYQQPQMAGIPGIPAGYGPAQQYGQPLPQPPMAQVTSNGANADEHDFSDVVNLSQASIWDPVQGSLPTGAYPVVVKSVTKRAGKTDPSKRNYWFECQVTDGDFKGQVARINIGSDVAEWYNANKLFTAALSCGYQQHEIASGSFRIADSTFKGRQGYIYVKAKEKKENADPTGFDPSAMTEAKERDEKCFITKDVYDRELGALALLNRSTNGQQPPVMQVQPVTQAPVAGIAPMPAATMPGLVHSMA